MNPTEFARVDEMEEIQDEPASSLVEDAFGAEALRLLEGVLATHRPSSKARTLTFFPETPNGPSWHSWEEPRATGAAAEIRLVSTNNRELRLRDLPQGRSLSLPAISA